MFNFKKSLWDVIVIDSKLEKIKYVWYASYGSNLNRDRFLCYIKGGKPKGSEKVEVGCRDKTLPPKEATYIMHYPLYFAKASDRWQKQGVAFIGLKRDQKHHTYSRKYLITVEQFMDVVKQENNRASLHIDLNEIIKNGSKTLLKDSWYGTVLYLGEEDGYPILTFTADWEGVPFTKPSKEYLGMIINGLRSTLGLENTDIVNYISSKPGVVNNYNKQDIEKLIE